MIKVFTKYDRIHKQINVPEIAIVKAMPLGDETDLSMPSHAYVWFPYYPMEIEEGLEKVVFVHYKRGVVTY